MNFRTINIKQLLAKLEMTYRDNFHTGYFSVRRHGYLKALFIYLVLSTLFNCISQVQTEESRTTIKSIGSGSNYINLNLSFYEAMNEDSVYYSEDYNDNNSINEFHVYTPFCPESSFYFEVTEPGIVEISLFDINGNQLAGMNEQELQVGKYEVNFDGGSIPSGIYFYVIIKNGVKQIKRKIMLMK